MLLRTYFPKTGQVLTCDFCTGFVEPEMVKIRPVIVVSPNSSHGRRLCTIVPLSTTPPNPVKAWHLELANLKVPGWTRSGEINWAKCDMLTTVGFDRLDKPHTRGQNGDRIYHTVNISRAELADVLACIRNYLTL